MKISSIHHVERVAVEIRGVGPGVGIVRVEVGVGARRIVFVLLALVGDVKPEPVFDDRSAAAGVVIPEAFHRIRRAQAGGFQFVREVVALHRVVPEAAGHRAGEPVAAIFRNVVDAHAAGREFSRDRTGVDRDLLVGAHVGRDDDVVRAIGGDGERDAILREALIDAAAAVHGELR